MLCILCIFLSCNKIPADRQLQLKLVYNGQTASHIQTQLYRHYLSRLGGWRNDWVATGISDLNGRILFSGLPKAIYYIEASGTSSLTGEWIKANTLVYLNDASLLVEETVNLTK